jgi:hypothetical protein
VENPKMYWHIHHMVLCEMATEPIENRVEYIKKYKAYFEVDTRLRLLKPVKGELPAAFVRAEKAYAAAYEILQKARDSYKKILYRSIHPGINHPPHKDAPPYIYEGEAHRRAWIAFDRAATSLSIARMFHRPEIEFLHRQECSDCPWDGKTIFPESPISSH